MDGGATTSGRAETRRGEAARIAAETRALLALRHDGADPARVAAWREARGRIVALNRPLVLAYVRAHPCGLRPAEDRIQDGLIGLARAAETFDPAKGAFATYATYWVRQAIRRATGEEAYPIRVPIYLQEVASQVASGRLDPADLTPDQRSNLADGLRAMGCRAAGHGAAPRRGGASDGVDPWAWIPAGDDPADPAGDGEALARLGRAMAEVLDDRQALVIRLRFGLDGGGERSLREIAPLVGVTRERVRQIERVALRRLRAALEGRGLRATAPRRPDGGFLGVRRSQGRYRARVAERVAEGWIDRHVGMFATAEEAAAAHDRAAYAIRGASARLNFPERIAEYAAEAEGSRRREAS